MGKLLLVHEGHFGSTTSYVSRISVDTPLSALFVADWHSSIRFDRLVSTVKMDSPALGAVKAESPSLAGIKAESPLPSSVLPDQKPRLDVDRKPRPSERDAPPPTKKARSGDGLPSFSRLGANSQSPHLNNNNGSSGSPYYPPSSSSYSHHSQQQHQSHSNHYGGHQNQQPYPHNGNGAQSYSSNHSNSHQNGYPSRPYDYPSHR